MESLVYCRVGAGLEPSRPDSARAGCCLHGISGIQARISGGHRRAEECCSYSGMGIVATNIGEPGRSGMVWKQASPESARRSVATATVCRGLLLSKPCCKHTPIGAEHAQDVRLLTAFLLMLWGALRYSDLQRVLVSDLCCEDGVARAACWRIKRSASGMTFGDLTLGIIDNWTHRSQELINFMKECDFLIAGPQRFRVPGFRFRTCWVIYGAC